MMLLCLGHRHRYSWGLSRIKCIVISWDNPLSWVTPGMDMRLFEVLRDVWDNSDSDIRIYKVLGNWERSPMPPTHTVTTLRLVCRERNIRVYQVRCKIREVWSYLLELLECTKMRWRSAGHLSRLWRLVGEVEAPNGCKSQCAMDVNANQMRKMQMLKQNRCKSIRGEARVQSGKNANKTKMLFKKQPKAWLAQDT